MAEKQASKDAGGPPPSSPLLSRPSTPQSGLGFLSPGSPLRSLRKKISLSGLSGRSRKASPGRAEGTRLGGHVPDPRSPSPPLRPLSVTSALLPFEFDVTREMDAVNNPALSLRPGSVGPSISPDPAKKITQADLPFTPPSSSSPSSSLDDSGETVKPVAGSLNMAPKPEQLSSPSPLPLARERVAQGPTEDKDHPAFTAEDEGPSGVVQGDAGSLVKMPSPAPTLRPAYNPKDKDLPVVPGNFRSFSLPLHRPAEHPAIETQRNGHSTVTGDFRSLALTQMPPPDLTQHPAFRSVAQMPPPDLTQHPAFQTEEEPPAVVTGHFRSLTKLPPPDISQHPAFQADPFSSRSDTPLMITTSTAEEIRRWRREQDRKKQEAECGNGNHVRFDMNTMTPSASRNAFAAQNNKSKMEDNPFAGHPMEGSSSPIHRRPIFPRPPPPPESLRTTMSRLQIDNTEKPATTGDNITGGSPQSATSPQPKSSSESSKIATTPISDGFDQKKSGFRRVTDMFKSKGGEKAEPAPRDYFEVPRRDLEMNLRITSNCPTFEYDPKGIIPRHPHTSRGWNSRNLRCTNCTNTCCAVCGRACCAYKAAANAMVIHKDNPESLKAARDRLFQITAIFPYGRETPTFLQCTKGGEIGCGKTVCPDCCGICPNLYCRDTQCRKCKKDPWSECQWHDEFMNRRAL